MTYNELLTKYREDYYASQTSQVRAVIALSEDVKNNESAPDFMRRKQTWAMACPPPIIAWIVLMNQEPLNTMLLLNQMGLTTIQDAFGRPGSCPVPKVYLAPDGTVDLTQAQATLDALHASYPTHPDYLPAVCPFNAQWPYNRSKGLWIPLDTSNGDAFTDMTPVGGLWKDPATGKEYQKISLGGQAGATGEGVLLWKDLSVA